MIIFRKKRRKKKWPYRILSENPHGKKAYVGKNVWYFTYFPRKKVYLLVSLYLTVLPVWVRAQTKTNKACKYAIVFF